jgi:hypothetical protein
MTLTTQHYIHFFDTLKNKWGGYIHDIHVLEQISKALQASGETYKAEKIIFKKINLGRNQRPIANYAEAFCELFIELKTTSIKTPEIKDPFTDYAMFIKLYTRINKLGVKDKPIKCVWHLDKDAAPSFDFSHPLYHFQFGGKEIVKDTGFDLGSLLLLEAPRMMHPPMDIILAIDFIIHNFYDAKERADLIKEKGYITAIKVAKEQFWKPYSMAFASNFYDFSSPMAFNIDKTFSNNILGT